MNKKILVSEFSGGFAETSDITLEELTKTMAKVDLILEAIALSHIRGADGACVPGCWSCKVEESLQALSVAKKMEG